MASHRDTPERPKISVRWPITIYTEKGPVEGEARNITGSGIFIHCKEQLRQNERCRMVIKVPQKKSVEVQGNLIWSNLANLNTKSNLAGTGFSFVKFSDEDRHILSEMISTHLKK